MNNIVKENIELNNKIEILSNTIETLRIKIKNQADHITRENKIRSNERPKIIKIVSPTKESEGHEIKRLHKLIHNLTEKHLKLQEKSVKYIARNMQLQDELKRASYLDITGKFIFAKCKLKSYTGYVLKETLRHIIIETTAEDPYQYIFHKNEIRGVKIFHDLYTEDRETKTEFRTKLREVRN